jgi:hypothetical protein
MLSSIFLKRQSGVLVLVLDGRVPFLDVDACLCSIDMCSSSTDVCPSLTLTRARARGSVPVLERRVFAAVHASVLDGGVLMSLHRWGFIVGHGRSASSSRVVLFFVSTIDTVKRMLHTQSEELSVRHVHTLFSSTSFYHFFPSSYSQYSPGRDGG